MHYISYNKNTNLLLKLKMLIFPDAVNKKLDTIFDAVSQYCLLQQRSKRNSSGGWHCLFFAPIITALFLAYHIVAHDNHMYYFRLQSN